MGSVHKFPARKLEQVPVEEIQHDNSAAYALVAIAFVAGVLIGTLIR